MVVQNAGYHLLSLPSLYAGALDVCTPCEHRRHSDSGGKSIILALYVLCVPVCCVCVCVFILPSALRRDGAVVRYIVSFAVEGASNRRGAHKSAIRWRIKRRNERGSAVYLVLGRPKDRPPTSKRSTLRLSACDFAGRKYIIEVATLCINISCKLHSILHKIIKIDGVDFKIHRFGNWRECG